MLASSGFNEALIPNHTAQFRAISPADKQTAASPPCPRVAVSLRLPLLPDDIACRYWRRVNSGLADESCPAVAAGQRGLSNAQEE